MYVVCVKTPCFTPRRDAYSSDVRFFPDFLRRVPRLPGLRGVSGQASASYNASEHG